MELKRIKKFPRIKDSLTFQNRLPFNPFRKSAFSRFIIYYLPSEFVRLKQA